MGEENAGAPPPPAGQLFSWRVGIEKGILYVLSVMVSVGYWLSLSGHPIVVSERPHIYVTATKLKQPLEAPNLHTIHRFKLYTLLHSHHHCY